MIGVPWFGVQRFHREPTPTSVSALNIPSSAKTTVMRATAWIAAGMALMDLYLRLHASNGPLLPPEPYPANAPPLDQLAQGAPFHIFSTITADYYAFRLHWMAIPAALLLVIALHALLRGRLAGQARQSALQGLAARLACGLLPAILLVGLLELWIVEAFPISSKFVADPTRVWRGPSNMAAIRPGLAPYTDADGFRPTPSSRGDGPLVLIVGDSTTFGTGVDVTEETYCWQLAQLLARERPAHPPHVLNRGVPGYSTWQGLTLLRELMAKTRPTVVVAAFMANDWTWSEQPDAELSLSGPAGHLRALLRQSKLYLLLERLVLGSKQGPGVIRLSALNRTRVSVADYTANLDEMRRLCVDDQAKLVLMCLPLAPTLEARSQPYRDAMALVATRPGCRFLDLYTAWKARHWNDRFFLPADPIHPTAQGHAAIARALANLLLPLIRR